MSIKLNSVGGGSVTIQEPNTASDFTLSVPARTGTTVLQDGSNNLLMNSGYGSDAVAYGCRAWVNFNGTGTVAIRASGNVSSITDNGTGNYTINFTNAMPDTNYSSSGMSDHSDTVAGNYLAGVSTWQGSTKTTSAFQFQTSRAQASGTASAIGPTLLDFPSVSVQIFR